jgi:hypothetical protein
MNAGAKRPTDVESPMWATVVHRVVVAATGDTVVLVVLVVVTAVELVVLDTVDTVGAVVVAAGAPAGAGTTPRMVVVADAAVGIATTRAGRVDAACSISPCASGAARQPAPTMTTTTGTTNASEATRRERATSRV